MDPWTTHVMSKSASDLFRSLIGDGYGRYPTEHPSVSGEIYFVDAGWDVYSVSLSDFTITLMETESEKPSNERPYNYNLEPVLSKNDKYLVLSSLGYATLYRFEIASRGWTTTNLLPPFPSVGSMERFAYCGSKLYILTVSDSQPGGKINYLWEVDISSDRPDRWELVRLASMVVPPGTYYFRIVSNEQSFLMSTDRSEPGGPSTWEYSPKTCTWTKVAPLPQSLWGDNWRMGFVNGTYLMTAAPNGSKEFRLGSLEVTDLPDGSRYWRELQGFICYDMRIHLTVFDKFRIIVFMSNERDNTIIRILDTRCVTSLEPDPLLADSLQQHYLSLVKLNIAENQVHSFKIPDRSAGEGGFCDVFVGTHTRTQIKCALKRPRLSQFTAENALRRIQREVDMWSTFDHPNVLPFLGIMTTVPHTFLVSPWVEGGDLALFSNDRVQYMKKEEDVNVTPDPKHDVYHAFDERRTLQGVAAGIAYLHSLAFVHGDLKGKNVLLTKDHIPLLCDFGMTKALDTPSENTSTTMKGVGTLRWQSPELFMNESKTFKSDVYAFAMIIVEVLTGSCPFPEHDEFSFLIQIIVQHKRPSLEPSLRNGADLMPLWAIAKNCWAADPKDRPSIEQVIEQLEAIPGSSKHC